MAKLPEIAVLAPHRHPRLRYVLGEAGRMLNLHFRLYTNPTDYQSAAGPRINYGAAPSERTEVSLFAHSFLSGRPPTPEDVVVHAGAMNPQDSQVMFFRSPDQDAADPFAILFFCLSRWEEYQPFPPDVHGRFPATQSHAHQNGYLHRPIVNEWLSWLLQQIEQTFPEWTAPPPTPFQLQLTYDIDVPYAYRFRGWRGLASGIRDILTGHFQRAKARFSTVLGPAKDPYDVFEQLQALHKATNTPARFFWLLAEQRSRFDPNLPPGHPALSPLVQSVAQWAEIGIHPSYHSSQQPTLFAREKDHLRAISEQAVQHSRQHFLRLNLPDTYRALIQAGLTHDHSMGYAAQSGWRAGTNHPFFWYDLQEERKTHLQIHPFAAMDVTLLRYQQLDACAAQNTIESLAATVRQFGGPFTLLWHNSSFAEHYGWAGWWEMYTKLVTGLREDS